MSLALAYLGSLAFVAYLLWLYRQRVPADDLKAIREQAARLKEIQDAVETLSIRAGFDPKWAARKVKVP